MRVATLFDQGRSAEAAEFVRVGVPQLRDALEFTDGEPSRLAQAYARERTGWHLFYDSLADVEQGIQEGAEWAESIRDEARTIISGCQVGRRA